jgi:hypothetical protein
MNAEEFSPPENQDAELAEPDPARLILDFMGAGRVGSD